MRGSVANLCANAHEALVMRLPRIGQTQGLPLPFTDVLNFSGFPTTRYKTGGDQKPGRPRFACRRNADYASASSKAALTRSAVNGTWRIRTPVASNTALPIAAPTWQCDGSPAPWDGVSGWLLT